jgi:hypothetical protein
MNAASIRIHSSLTGLSSNFSLAAKDRTIALLDDTHPSHLHLKVCNLPISVCKTLQSQHPGRDAQSIPEAPILREFANYSRLVGSLHYGPHRADASLYSYKTFEI